MMRKAWLAAVCASVLFGSMAGVAQAADGIKTQQVQFKKGESGATINGTIQGSQTLDYKLTANKGQSMEVILTGKPYFDILPPGSTGEAIFIGSTEGNNFEATLPAKGTYTIRVYQMGAAESSKAKTPFKLEVGISG
ncbi:DNA breaking-rejoining protein [Aeromonas sp.]|uniref:DNA breaking-rejoining protein n=1 Tax=Aeromonas sp. TaxID=647 RepID=UPI002586398C|nr:DNA breaking-rejoining protein [Aeromonas sp.]